MLRKLRPKRIEVEPSRSRQKVVLSTCK